MKADSRAALRVKRDLPQHDPDRSKMCSNRCRSRVLSTAYRQCGHPTKTLRGAELEILGCRVGFFFFGATTRKSDARITSTTKYEDFVVR